MKTVLISLICFVLSKTTATDNTFGIKEFTLLDTEPFDIPNDNSTDPSITRGSRIVFGSTASTGQFPHFALIFVRRPTVTVQCGAGLLAVNWALTADHCVRDAISIELRLGITSRNSYEQLVYASALARSTDTDIALIRLASNFRTTSLVKPALLPRKSERNQLFAKRIATVCGMGIENQKTNAVSSYLKFADLEIMTNAECGSYYGPMDMRVVCAKSSVSYASTCPGDSGSPLILKENGSAVIIGVVSFGAASGCDLGYPVGYARISYQLDWIEYYTGLQLRA